MKQNTFTCLQKFILLLAFTTLTVLHHAKAQTQKPNIIFILGDDIGYRTLTCNEGNLYSTPNLDTMAQNGIRFTQCHASPYCSPSRYMLVTGKYSFRNYTSWGDLDTSERTIGNMMKDAGYKTACYGKWQLGGGDLSAHTFGFDTYCFFNPFGPEDSASRYKNPTLYTNGAFVSSEETLNKYSEDIFTDSVIAFMNRNKSVPFFIYYPMALGHAPWQPTPDDTAFANWDVNRSDKSFYPSMIKYMDKKIGQIIAQVKSLGIEKNTVIVYAGDNGSARGVPDYLDGDSIQYGGKSITTEAGTHVPLIVLWDGTVNAGTVNNDLVGFTDFLPTFAGIANIPVPTNYGPLDGVSFAPRLTGNAGTPRDWIFYHYDPFPGYNTYQRWTQNINYKLYDTSSYNSQRLFYNIIADPKEQSAIPDNLLTPEEMKIKQQFLNLFTNYITQGFALFKTPRVLDATDTSAIIKDTISIDGGSGITARGVVWGLAHNPILSSGNYTLDGTGNGIFASNITGLNSNGIYYVRTYATNVAGTAYSKEDSFTTALPYPVATAATSVKENSFSANWESLVGATGYKLDVSTSPTFSTYAPGNLTEGFNNGATAPPGWIININIHANTKIFGIASPSLQIGDDGVKIVTEKLNGPATQLSFWIKGSNTNAGSLLVEGFDGLNWSNVDNIINPPSSAGIIKTYNAASTPPLGNNFIKFRFTFSKSEGNVLLDDVSINYDTASPSFLAGYDRKPVSRTSALVTGLTRDSNYYYRVSAVYNTGVSGYSNVITVTTCSNPLIINISATDLTCNGNHSGAVTLNAAGKNLSYSWTGVNGFTSNRKDISSLAAGNYQVIITSNGGCALQRSITITEPPALKASASAETIAYNGGTAMVTVTATGGTGNYSGTGTFSQVAGTTTYTVTDANGCTASVDVTLTEPVIALEVIPNPTPGMVKVIFTVDQTGKCAIKISDLSGKVLFTKELDATAGSNHVDLNLNGLAKGTYMVTLINKEERKTVTFIKGGDKN